MAYIAVFVALVISSQLVLSFIPGVEIVTLLFCAYAFCFGVKRGIASATAFSLLRQIVFGFAPSVLITYLVYCNLLTVVFALLGKVKKKLLFTLPLAVVFACVCTACFTLLDDLITPLYYGFLPEQTQAYFYYSLPTMLTQTVCAGSTVFIGFIPVCKAFQPIKRKL